MRDFVTYLRRQPWHFALAWALWWVLILLGLAWGGHVHGSGAMVQGMYGSSPINHALTSHLPAVLTIFVGNGIELSLWMLAVLVLAANKEASPWVGKPLKALVVLFLVVNLGLQGRVAWLAGAFFGANGGVRNLLGLPHGVLEFAAYALPLGLLLNVRHLPRERSGLLWAAWGSGLALLAAAAAVEVYVSPLVRAALHLPWA